MNYRIDIHDRAGRRIASYDDVPLLEAVRRRAAEDDTIAGVLPENIAELGPGYTVRVHIEGALFCEASVTSTAPEWSDARKLILDKYVAFHNVIAFEARRDGRPASGLLGRAYQNRDAAAVVRDAINAALGPIHYTVDHTAYPDGAQREYAKFLARKTDANELGLNTVATGDWVGADRIDATAAYAKDGDTIAGLVVDGDPWPDLRLMMVDCEETSLNSHAINIHPELAGWDAARYNASGYKLKADAATAFLQDLIDTHGIAFIELNPHRGPDGAYDDRVDAFGRYLGLIYGGGECFNAALVEQGHAAVYLYDDGKYHVPEMALKDFYSYTAPNTDSIAPASAVLTQLDLGVRIDEALTALAYAAGGYLWEIDPNDAVSFRPASVDRVVFFDPLAMGIAFGADTESLVNILLIEPNPQSGLAADLYYRGESIDAYGKSTRFLEYFGLSAEADAQRLADGLLDDLAYPEPNGAVTFYGGRADLQVGRIVEIRGAPVRILDAGLPEAYGGRFDGKIAARIAALTHRFTGRYIETRAELASPLRSVADPLTFMVRSQPAATALYQFRLDAEAVGLDLGYHLD